MRNALALALFFALPISSVSFAGDHEELKKNLISVSEANRTPAQKLVVELMQKFDVAMKDLGCAPNLDAAKDKTRLQVVLEQLPPWLEHLAEKAFLDRVTFDPRTVALLNNHRFNVDLHTSVVQSSAHGKEIEELIRRQWLEVPPTEDPGSHGSIRATVSNVRTFDGSASFDLDVTFANGQRLRLKFPRVELGRESVAPVVARMVIAAINHREGLATEDRLRQEMNAFRYDLGKLLRVTAPETQAHVVRMQQTLVDAQPKVGFLQTLGRNLGFKKKDDERLGQAFATYMKVREEVVLLAQTARGERLDEKVPADAPDQVQIVQRLRPSVAPGRLATAFVAPRPVMATASPRARPWTERVFRRDDRVVDDSTYFFNTYIWMTDPSFMLTHPLYWGSRDGSFMSYMMYYDWMATEQHRRDRLFENQTPPPAANMTQFDHPVDPVYTNDQTAPFADPWNVAALASADVLTPQTAPDGSVDWVDANGQPADFFYLPSSDVDRAWDKVTGGDKVLSGEDSSGSSGETTKSSLSPAESERWDSGTSGGAPTPAADPDADIRGSN